MDLSLLLLATGLAQAPVPAYRIDTFVGSQNLGDGGLATIALLDRPTRAVQIPGGDTIVLDSYHRRVRRIGADGKIRTIAGTVTGYSGDGGPATAAELCFVDDVASDPDGNLYFLDRFYCVVRRIDAKTGVISTVAGTGQCSAATPGAEAAKSTLSASNIALGPKGQLVIADTFGHRILTVDAAGKLVTLAGNGKLDEAPDNVRADLFSAVYPTNLSYDGSGNLFFIEYGMGRVRRIGLDGLVTTVAGSAKNSTTPRNGDGGPSSLAKFVDPSGLAVDPSGRFVYVADRALNRIRLIDTQSKTIDAYAAVPTRDTRPDAFPGFYGDGKPAAEAFFAGPTGLSLTSSGALLIADTNNHRIRQVAPQTKMVSTIAGRARVAFTGKIADFEFASPNSIALAMDPVTGENLLVADNHNYYLSAIPTAANQPPQLYAGGSIPSGAFNTQWYTYFAGEGGPGSRATLENPRAATYDPAANRTYLLDGPALRYLEGSSRTIRTLVATGLANSDSLAWDPVSKRVLIADWSRHQILAVDPANPSTLAVVAGQANKPGLSGDNGPAVNAQLDTPFSIAVDKAGVIYIGDWSNQRIRRIVNGTISTYVGGGRITPGVNHRDNVPAAEASLFNPQVAITPNGDLVFSMHNAGTVFHVSAQDRVVRLIAGSTDRRRFDGDGGLASGASLVNAGSVQVDSRGNIYVLDPVATRIRKLTPVTLGALEVVAGKPVSGAAGAELEVTVRVKDQAGSALKGADVVFEVLDGDATVSAPFSIVTAADGLASARIKLGVKAGTVKVNARTPGAAPVVITLTVNAPAAAATFAAAAGDAQFAELGQPLAAPLQVRALDTAGTPLAGVPVIWQVATGAATLGGAGAVTQADGTASVQVTIGNAPGPVVVTATAGALSASFALTAIEAAPEVAADGIAGAGASDPPVRTAAPLGLLTLRGARVFPFGANARAASADDLVEAKLPELFQGVCVEVNGTRAPIAALEANGGITFQVPALGDAAEASVMLLRDCGKPYERRSAAILLPASTRAPEIFVASRNEANGPLALTLASPVVPESEVTIIATGLGITTPPLAPGESGEAPVEGPVTVRLAGQTLPATAAGLAGSPGRYTVKFTLPAGVTGLAEVDVTVGGVTSPVALLPIGQ